MNIIVEGEQLIVFMSRMINYLNHFQEEVLIMQNLTNELIWEGPVKEKIVHQYREILQKYLQFAKKMYILIDYLNTIMDVYDDGLEEIKENFKKLESTYNMKEGKLYE